MNLLLKESDELKQEYKQNQIRGQTLKMDKKTCFGDKANLNMLLAYCAASYITLRAIRTFFIAQYSYSLHTAITDFYSLVKQIFTS